MQKRKKRIAVILACLIVASAVGILMTYLFQVNEDEPIVSLGDVHFEEDEDAWGRTVHIDGHTYRYNSRLRSVLFMGVDSSAKIEEEKIVGDGGRADAIVLFVMDPDAKTIRMVEVSRDTMIKVDVYNKSDKKLYSGTMQINMQYAFGSSPARSCQLMKNKVSELLYSLPITSYCSMTMDGISAAVDLIGGVTVTFPDDWTDVDPEYQAGATVRMDAKEVERFLRFRDHSLVESNDKRMARQSWFVREMFRQFSKAGRLGAEMFLEKLDPYLEQNMDADVVKMLVSYAIQPEVYKVPGKSVDGEIHYEYYVDDDALQKMVLDLFYIQQD